MLKAMIDGHNDLPWAMSKPFGCSLDVVDIALPVAGLQTDVPRLRARLIGLYAFGNAGKRGGGGDLEQFDFVLAMIARGRPLY